MIPKKKLSDIAVIYNGNSINKTVKQQKYMKDIPGWNYIGTKDIDFDGSVTYKTGVVIPFSESKFRTAPVGTVFVCSEGGSAGKKTAIIKEEVCFGNKLFAIVNKDDLFIPQYVYYYTRYKAFLKQFKLLASTLMGGITAKNFGSIEIPLPGKKEQRRIVLRIEELFSSLDNAVETLNKTKEQLAVYRQAVLKEAFEGIDTCAYKEITSLCDNIVDCPHSTPKWVHNGKLCLRTTNFRRGYLDLSEKNYVSVETYNERIARLKPEPGDVLFSREGAILGLACIIPSGLEICMGQRMMLLRPSKEMNNRYLMHYLNSPISRQLIVENVGGSASPHINVGDIKRFKIPFVNRNKQEEIVSMVDARLSLCDSIEATVDNALAKAEAMRQSILKEAFEGRLV